MDAKLRNSGSAIRQNRRSRAGLLVSRRQQPHHPFGFAGLPTSSRESHAGSQEHRSVFACDAMKRHTLSTIASGALMAATLGAEEIRDPREAALGAFDQRLRLAPEDLGLREGGGPSPFN